NIPQAHIRVKAVEVVIDYPEILDWRVKTLHPFIHVALLADMENPSHKEQLKNHKIDPIEIVVVNLYPFKQTLAKEGVSEAEIIENIDIGGPTMLRAAAKNFKNITVVVVLSDYELVLKSFEKNELNLEK